ncbi:hypothetical protein L211DRAFT_810029 [Terfezia boudieri ATCC MYA-4762]|uniref:Uncharacterized protein n=1 Tax=Terfezia boudieri ATCC MYA-4762 TaxID=1051890 RepID=A0A3N4LPD1_9PEZI|nr:hypothetical protein L211DRAFT_810029 [Terfezia boudieri ATCC MYA-4762]
MRRGGWVLHQKRGWRQSLHERLTRDGCPCIFTFRGFSCIFVLFMCFLVIY